MDNDGFRLEEIFNYSTESIRRQSRSSKDSSIDLWETVDKSQLEQNLHLIPLDELFHRFHSNPRFGLSTDEVLLGQKQYGKNRLTPPKSPSYIFLLIKELFMGFNCILWLAGVLAFASYKPFSRPHSSISNLALGFVLFIVITCNSILNVYQQLKSIKIVASFSKLLPSFATVRRDGREQQILTDELVPGDVVLIRMGDKIPADCRFFRCESLKINTSELTGESKPISATIRPTSVNLMETTNIGFYSSMVEQGTGEAIVIATGDKTILGQMSRLTQSSTGDEITGLHREVNRFVLFVILVTIGSILLLWIIWAVWLNRFHHGFITFNANIVNSIGMIVGFLPLGLPSAVTLGLTIVAKQMYQQRVLVKSLQIVETFNSVSVIATDKTGTLTQNKMTVTHFLWDQTGIYKVPLAKINLNQNESFLQKIRRVSSGFLLAARRYSSSRKTSIDDISIQNEIIAEANDVKFQVFRDLLLGAALCNNAEKQIVQDGKLDDDLSNLRTEMRIVGDAADTALYNMCVDHCHVDIERVRAVNPRLKALPFNSTNKFMISAHQLETIENSTPKKDRIVVVFLKGAPDIVIQRCSTYKTETDEIVSFENEIKNELIDRQETLGKNGYRVIAMCQRRMRREEYDELMNSYKEKQNLILTTNDEDLNGFSSHDYCFLGLFSLLDPPRPEVPDAVQKARSAQIRVAMVTGDHPTTAKAIAKQVHILTSDIAETNGLDTFKFEKQSDGSSIFNLYRNDKFIEQHLADETSQTNSSSIKTTKKSMEDESFNWFQRFSFALKHQFTETNVDMEPKEKMSYIPYAIVVTGSDLHHMDDFMWNWVLSHQELVFARTSPEQKLQIVFEFQRRGEIVAVTGDGTNDAPALKCANLGVAMQSGTEVSKEAGDLILLDNNFASIIRAIETGRLLSDNLKKVAIYLLPGGSWSQIWPIFFSLLFGMPLALPAFLATVFCMLNDVFMSLAMVKEKAERDIMSRAPSIRSKDHLLNWKLLLHAYLFVGNLECFTAFFCFCYFWIDNGVPFYSFMFTYEKFGIDPPVRYTSDELFRMTGIAQSIYYCSVCLFQFFNYFATRTRYTSIFHHNPFWGKGRNWYVFAAMFASILIQILITQLEFFHRVFNTGPVPIKYILPTLLFGLLWLIIDESRKWFIRQYPKSFLAKIAW